MKKVIVGIISIIIISIGFYFIYMFLNIKEITKPKVGTTTVTFEVDSDYISSYSKGENFKSYFINDMSVEKIALGRFIIKNVDNKLYINNDYISDFLEFNNYIAIYDDNILIFSIRNEKGDHLYSYNSKAMKLQELTYMNMNYSYSDSISFFDDGVYASFNYIKDYKYKGEDICNVKDKSVMVNRVVKFKYSDMFKSTELLNSDSLLTYIKNKNLCK